MDLDGYVLAEPDCTCTGSVLLETTKLRLYGEAKKFEITNHCMPKLECDGPPRVKTPGLAKDHERPRGKHKCTKHKGATREKRGAEAIIVKACCECTGYTESVLLAVYTRPPKLPLLCTGPPSDTISCDTECAPHPELHAAIDFGTILPEKH